MLNAAEANNIAHKVQEKLIAQELIDTENLIKDYAEKGIFEIRTFKLYNKNIHYLRENGYTVTEDSDTWCTAGTMPTSYNLISWEDVKDE